MNLRFKNPPINELVIGTYFDPPLYALRSEHIGLLWARLRDEFPTVQQREPLGGWAAAHETVMPIGSEFLIMPRFWFISENESNLIQVQKNAFLLNWRKRESEYPHFTEHLKPNFDKYYDVFDEFAREDVGVGDLQIGRCELTYVDLIQPCDYWKGPEDTSKLIPSFVVPDFGSAHGVAPAFDCGYRFEPVAGVQLHVAIRTAEAADDPGSPCLVLEFKAIGDMSGVPKSSTERWYKQAHDTIVACFLNMTSQEIQRTYWILEEKSE